jgi:hypothetical protein
MACGRGADASSGRGQAPIGLPVMTGQGSAASSWGRSTRASAWEGLVLVVSFVDAALGSSVEAAVAITATASTINRATIYPSNAKPDRTRVPG